MTIAALVTLALLGTEREQTPLPPLGPALDQFLARLDQTDREARLLAAAGAVAQFRQVGQLPAKDETPLPTPCEPDERPLCSPAMAELLATLLSGEYREVLPEWLELLDRQGRRVPHAQLVALLVASHTGNLSGAAYTHLWNVLDKRGRWLASQNPAWKSMGLPVELVPESWQVGSRAERLQYLEQLRRKDSPAALTLIMSTWKQEKAEDRQNFLKQLEVGLSMDDEPFLEAALDDRSKEVRKTAATLLAHLPESRLVKRAIARVEEREAAGQPLIKLVTATGKKKKTGLEVSLFEEYDKGWERDGIEEKSQDYRLGDKTWWLLQTVAVIPPSYWTAKLGLTTDELITAALGNEWRDALVRGWVQAASAQSDLEWAETLLNRPYKEVAAVPGVSLTELAGVLPPERRESLVLQMIKTAEENELNHYDSPIQTLLGACQFPWSRELSQAVALKMVNPKLVGQFTWRGYERLMLPELGAQLESVFGQSDELKSNKQLEKFIAVLKFRQQIHKESSR